MVSINHLFERIETLELLEEGYGPAIPIQQLTISKKAFKQISKNHFIKRIFSSATTFNAQLLNAETIYGAYSFAIKSLRGLGTRNKNNTYILNWIGSHEDYNKEKTKA